MSTSSALAASAPRLMRPSAKMHMRLLRTAVTKVAWDEDMEYMDLEDIYTNTRSALVHLMEHSRYRTHIEDKMEKVVRLTGELLACPGVEKLSKNPQWTSELAEAAAALDGARKSALVHFSVTPRTLGLFLRVIEANREAHLAEHCDPSEIITPELYAVAQLVAVNFKAYDQSLNT